MKVRRRTRLRTINSGFAIASYDLFLLGFWSLERSLSTQYTTIFPGAIFPRDGIELATLSDGFLLSQTL